MPQGNRPRGYLTPEQAAERLGLELEDAHRKYRACQIPGASPTEDGGWVVHAATLERRLKKAEDDERFKDSGAVVGCGDFEEELEASDLCVSETGDPADAIPIADDFRARQARHEQEAATRRRGSAPVRARAAMIRARPRARGAGRPRVRATVRTSSRGGDSGDDGSGSSAGDGDPPRDLLADTKDYLSRLGPHGAEREWLVDQVAYLGHEPEIVGVALALLTSEGKAGRSVDEDGADVIWGRS